MFFPVVPLGHLHHVGILSMWVFASHDTCTCYLCGLISAARYCPSLLFAYVIWREMYPSPKHLIAIHSIGPGDLAASQSATFPHLIETFNTDDSSACTMAFDAPSLAQANVECQDRRLAQQADVLYQRAIRRFRGELSRAVTNKDFPEQLLATPYVLFWGSMFRALMASGGGRGSIVHLHGLAYILQAKAGSRSHLQNLLLDNYHMFLFSLGVLKRTSTPSYMTPTDIQALSQVQDRFPLVSMQSMALSALIERSDRLANTTRTEREQFFVDLFGFEASMHKLLYDMGKACGGAAYEIIAIARMPSYNEKLDALSSSILGDCYCFRSYQVALALDRI